MITISATTTSLLIGFATALLGRIDPRFFFFNYVAVLLGGGLILTIVSIVIFLFSGRPGRYGDVLTDTDVIKNILDRVGPTPDQLMRMRLLNYLDTIVGKSRVNEKRNRMIYKGELVFVANIIVILVSIMLQLLAVLQGQIIQPTIGG